MTVNQLEYFMTLAQTLNYTKASEKLYLTQPHLSKTIANLEQEMGAQLFLRSRRDVSLTPAGAVFYEDVEKIMGQLRTALLRAKGVGEGYRGSIDIGYIGTAMARMFPVIMERFKELYPDIHVNLYDFTYRSLVDALKKDEIDVAFLLDRELGSLTGLQKRHIASDAMCLVVGKDHPLAGRKSIYLADAAQSPFVLLDPKVSGRDYGIFSDMCLEQGVQADIKYTANSLHNLLIMVDCGMGVAVLAEHMAQFASKDTRFIRIRGYENCFRLMCAWPKDRNPCTCKLLDVLDRCELAM